MKSIFTFSRNDGKAEFLVTAFSFGGTTRAVVFCVALVLG